MSLVYLLPKSRREAASRFFTGLSCGLIFGGPTGLWIVRTAGAGRQAFGFRGDADRIGGGEPLGLVGARRAGAGGGSIRTAER